MYQDKHWINCTLFIAFIFCLLSACSSQPSTDMMSELKLQTPRYGHASATDGKRIFVFAGSNNGKFLSNVEIIDPVNGKVTVLKNKVIPRRYFSAVWDGKDSIYLIGGVTYLNRTATLVPSVEIFNINSFAVTFAAPLPAPRRNSRAVMLDNHIYVMGGSNLSKQKHPSLKPTALTAVYNVDSNEWKKLADMPTAKSTAPVIRDGLIYVAGGFDHKSSLNVFEKFNPKINQWESLPSLPRPVSAHSAVYAQNKLYLFGDYYQLNSVLVYDFNQEKWHESTLDYQASRHNTAVVIGNVLYVIGGNTNSKGKALDFIQQFTL